MFVGVNRALADFLPERKLYSGEEANTAGASFPYNGSR